MGARPRRPADFSTADENLAEMLDSLSGADRYLDFLIELMADDLRPPILEIGSGVGDTTERLARFGATWATDLSDRFLADLRRRYGESPEVHVGRFDAVSGDLPDGLPERGAESVVLINVLEHIEDDRAAIANLRSCLAPGGSMIVFVPAFELLYGRFDADIGHFRRYRRSTLTEVFVAAGLEVQSCRYVNAPGWFAWLLTVRLLRQAPTNPAKVAFYDRWVIPVVRALEIRMAPPFGQSVLGIARRPLD